MIWFVKLKKNCYPKIFVEQFKYKEKEKEIVMLIPEDIESSSSSNNYDDDDEFIEKDFK